jgi:hypothetical protein
VNQGSNYHGSDPHGPLWVWLVSANLILAVVSTFVRIYTRLKIARSFSVDDMLLFCGLLSAIGLSICVYLGQFFEVSFHYFFSSL